MSRNSSRSSTGNSARSRLTNVMERNDSSPGGRSPLPRQTSTTKKTKKSPAKKKTTPAKKKTTPAKKKTTPAKKKATTPVKKTPPAKRQQQGDKYELSPTGRAKCTKCRKIINKGEKRVGKEVYEERYSNYIHYYYHDQCYPKALKEQLKLKAATPEDELARAVNEQQTQKYVVTGERRELFEALKTLRYGFGQKLDCEDQLARIFSNKTLEQMTAKMPLNQQDMIANVYGMGPKKYESFGEAFLQVIQHYARKYDRYPNTKSRTRASTGPSKSTVTSRPAVSDSAAGTADDQVVIIDSDDDDVEAPEILPPTDIIERDDDDDGVEAVESLSCTEIIQRKFEHAATNGYVISLE